MHKRKKQRAKYEKHRTKLTQEYIKTEVEVSSLIQIQEDDKKSDITKTTTDNQINFFTSEIISLDFKQQKNGNEFKTSEKESSIVSESSETVLTQQPASSYIQIEDIVSPINKTESIKIHFLENLFYIPSSKESINLLLNRFEEKQQFNEILENHGFYVDKRKFPISNSNMIRMINRYLQEGRFLDFIETSTNLRNQQQKNYLNQILYQFNYQYRKFKPILHVFPLYNNQNIETLSSRKYLTIIFKELKFTEHPLQTEEHRLANKLESLYKVYEEKLYNNYIEKITIELKTVREIIQKLFEKIENDNVTNNNDNLQKLENYMQHAKNLRNALYKEELINKNLIKSILDTWLALKSLRKRQGIEYTNIKLKIQVEENERNMEEILWEKRFQIELNEIVREEYEIYYREKRNQKHEKSSKVHQMIINKPNIEVIKKNLRDTLTACTKLPGEPNIILSIINNNKNELRSNNDKRTFDKIKEYYFKIFCDNHLLGSSKNFKLKSNFTISLNETFTILLDRRIPQNIKIEVSKNYQRKF